MGRKPNNTGATSLAHIQHSSQPVSAEQAYKDEQEQGYSNVALSGAKEQTSEWVIFKLVNTKKRGRVYIDCINDTWNPDTKKVERMRLLSGEQAIWVKDQKHLTEDYIRNNRRTMIFEGKICRVPSYDTAAIEFLRLSSHCIDNPNRKTGSKTEFFEWNPVKQAQEAAKKQMLKIEAMKKAFSVDDEHMKKHALYLGISPIDEVGLPKPIEAMRNEYAMKADLDPKGFMESFESPLVEISFLVKKALNQAKIDVGRERNKAYWATGKFICSIMPHQKPIDSLVELASSNTAEGREFLNELKLATQSA